MKNLTIDDVIARLSAFTDKLKQTRAGLNKPAKFWYPFQILNNAIHLDRLLTKNNRKLGKLIGSHALADIGAGDGEMSFLFESLGYEVDIVENPPTNHNYLAGARTLAKALNSKVKIYECDLDSQFRLPRERYGLVLFFGILYHLKNPFYALEQLARQADYIVISTRIARYTPDKKTYIDDQPLAYLVHATEANNDPFNYWIFSDAGLKRILDRSGWQIVDYMRAGNLVNSDPASDSGDERAFVLAKSKIKKSRR